MHLRRSAERVAEVEELAAALTEGGGGRVGLAGVLDHLDRRAHAVRVPGRAARWGFAWDDADERDRRWWPQGITTSADHDASEAFDGRPVLLTSWYARASDGSNQGSRITVVDLGEDGRLRYRHVLLVTLTRDGSGALGVQPLRVHAGGLVWHGDHLHVAATTRGLAVCRPDDVLRVGGATSQLGRTARGLGHRYLLPVRFTYDAGTEEGHQPLRYSFASLSRDPDGALLTVGEYGRTGPTRLTGFAVDPATSLLRTSDDGRAWPVSPQGEGVHRMQGATVVDGRWYVTTSSGPTWRGSLYVGTPGSLARRARVLPPGVEDVTYWPSRDELWSLTEYPGRRWVFAMDRSRLG